MKIEVVTAIIAAIVAIMSAILSVYGQMRVARLSDRLAQQREVASREAQTTALMSKYRDPLLRSAIDLQSRLFNIRQNYVLHNFDQRSLSEQEYLINNTLYVFAEYFGWVEILRREIQFLDLGDLELNRRLSELLVNITKAFGTNHFNGQSNFDSTFQLFNGEQRAIGEIMMQPRSTDQTLGYECIGYAAFVQKMSDSEFARWFIKLKADLNEITTQSTLSGERLILIHSRLIDLIDFLDPRCVRVPLKYRTRIK
ncbi:hypothetical protein H6G89_10515 [Oscillatoria sp. FACHB-1407]|uniref:hypothetical protein n=1 Tax=Oscillatoria sp. FACHB-1407 TaxID=2692847 RepID=UPI00168373B3|nr:hypothetical protein [Oscillatoria sp. FACHB-1407]MBD2461481.1 hypothetical protein [Oscillatoria sp. FACHB-1407]